MKTENPNFDEFFEGCIEAALYQYDHDDKDDTPLFESYTIEDFNTNTLNELKTEALEFFNNNIELINQTPDDYSYEEAGFDFMETRYRSTTFGFNGEESRLGRRLGAKLEKIALEYGYFPLTIGDDNKIYRRKSWTLKKSTIEAMGKKTY